MAMLKCKMCGGDLTVEENATVCECEYCGTKQTVPNIDDEKILKLYERANRLRMASEFDKASAVYESIIAEKDTDAEAYWGLVLCKFGIEYVDDPATGDKIPTCHRSSFDSVMKDSDFEMVMENADSISKSVYREQAKQIEEIRKGIIEVSGKEQPYDIFICYKETADNGQRTIDSVIAQDVYDALTDKGYRVFFSRISLEDKLGTEYEPYIFAALNSAKIMLAFGTNYDYYNAVWVKNEWSRFIKLMAKDKSKHLIPCYKDIDAYDMPEEFARLQAQDMSKVGAIQDLVRGIDKIIGKSDKLVQGQETSVVEQVTSGYSASLERGFMMLEDENWDRAESLFEDVLNQNPKCASAYMGKLLRYYKMNSPQEFANFIFAKFFYKRNRTAITINYDVNEVLEKNCKWINDAIRERIISNYKKINFYNLIECLEKYDSTKDYVKEFLDNENDDSAAANKYYQRYLQYATDSERNHFNISGKIEALVKNTLAAELAGYEHKKKMYSEEYLLSILDEVKRQINEQCGGNFEAIENQYKSDVLKWEKECEEIILNWPNLIADLLAKWEQKKIEIDQKYEQEKVTTESYNKQIENQFNVAMSEYIAKIEECNRRIANYEGQLAAITGLFKGKQKDEIRTQIAIIQTERDNIRKPIIEDYGALRDMPIAPDYPTRPDETPVKPSMPVIHIPDSVDVEKIIMSVLKEMGIAISNKKTIVLGSYKGEPIEWFILDEDGNNKLLISKMALDAKPYNEEDVDITWEECSLREWLNKEFIDEALSCCKDKIILTNVTDDYNPKYDTDWGEETQDKIFLLSIDEVEKYFDTNDEDEPVKSHEISEATCFSTQYVKATPSFIWKGHPAYPCDENDDDYGSCDWWLRSPGRNCNDAAYVSYDGSVSYGSYGFYGITNAVRPALWINLES